MKKFEEMDEDEIQEFLESIEDNAKGDPHVRTPTIEIFELAVKCMGFNSTEEFCFMNTVTFEELKDHSWFIMGQSLYIED